MLLHQSDCSGKVNCVMRHQPACKFFAAKLIPTITQFTARHISTCPSFCSESVQTLFFDESTGRAQKIWSGDETKCYGALNLGCPQNTKQNYIWFLSGSNTICRVCVCVCVAGRGKDVERACACHVMYVFVCMYLSISLQIATTWICLWPFVTYRMATQLS